MSPPIQADLHPFVAKEWIGLIRAEQPVPPRKNDPEIAIAFLNPGGMVYPVHIRRNHQPPQHLFKRGGEAGIGMTI